jgi:hypothetical protein
MVSKCKGLRKGAFCILGKVRLKISILFQSPKNDKFEERLKGMNTTALRQQLHDYIDQANDSKITGLFLLVEDQLNEMPGQRFSETELAILNEEREKYLCRPETFLRWNEAKSKIRSGNSGNKG